MSNNYEVCAVFHCSERILPVREFGLYRLLSGWNYSSHIFCAKSTMIIVDFAILISPRISIFNCFRYVFIRFYNNIMQYFIEIKAKNNFSATGPLKFFRKLVE